MAGSSPIQPSFSPVRWLALGTLLILGGCAATNGALVGRSASSQASMSLRLAEAARQAGDLGAAIRLYRKVVDQGSPPPRAMVEFGDTLVQAGLPDDAIIAYRRVDKSSAVGLGASLGLVRAYVALHNPAAALPYADQAVADAPHDVRALVDRGVVLDSLERHAEAQKAYRTALQAAPGNVPASNDLALSLALTGQYDQAMAIMEPLARSAWATPKIRENLALILGLSGDPERAAAVSRLDLDAAQTAANLKRIASLRAGGP